MKKIIFGAMAAAALLACSKEQVIEQNRANDEIGFSVVAENQTKAEDVYASNNKMEAFTVAATYTNTKTGSTSWYFQNDLITKVQNGENEAWVNTTATRYWSADGTHDFYAIVNGSMTLGSPTDEPTVTVDFTPATTVEAQKDLLYAVAADKEKSNDPVMLNFRHALSQIQFKAKNTNSKLYVKISGVQVGNTPGVGTFTYPTTANGARWTYNTPTDYTVTFPAVGVAGNSTNPESVALTCTNEKSMLLIPATTEAWVPERGEGTEGSGGGGEWGGEGEDDGVYPGPGGESGDEGDDGGFDNNDGDDEGKIEESVPEFAMRRYNTASAGASDVTGSYLAVKCQIYNVAGGTYNSDTDVCLYDGWAMIPAKFEWAQGNKYIYTFVFGEGDFGYNAGEGDTPTTPDGEKVLTTMNYTVEVDNFTPVAETEKNMETL